jgi:hypothetical protein
VFEIVHVFRKGSPGGDGGDGETANPVQLVLVAFNEYENSLVLSGSVTDKIQFTRPDGIILACAKGGDAGCGGHKKWSCI